MKDQTNNREDISDASTDDAFPVEQIDFGDLYLSDLNVRKTVDPAMIERLTENIRALGLIHNLCGLRNEGGRIGIVAGGRRLRALALLQDDARFRQVPVKITEDIDVAKSWAASENHLREALHPADEIREFARMAEDGRTVPEIALAFGVSEAQVYRRLKLASLPKEVLSALQADEITLGAAACFTLCNDCVHALSVLERIRCEPVSEGRLRRLLKPESVLGSDRRVIFVGEAAYIEAGGRLTHDLFADEVHYDDPEILDAVFCDKLAALASEVQETEGWKWAATCPGSYVGWYQIEEMKAARLYPEPGVLSEADAETYDALAERAEAGDLSEEECKAFEALEHRLDGAYSPVQKALSGVLLYVDGEGVLNRYAGLVAKEDHAAAVSAGILDAPNAAHGQDQPRPAISAKLRRDLACIARGARQQALLDHPDLLLDLLAFQLSGRMGYRSAFGVRPETVETEPDIAEGYDLDKRLSQTQIVPKDPVASDLTRAFRAFRKRGHSKVRADLTRQLAALVSIDDATFGAFIDKAAGTDIRALWTPTAAGFFGRIRGEALDGLFRDILDLPETHPSATIFARLRKSEKAERLEKLFGDADYRKTTGLSAAQLLRIDKWLPEGME